MQQNKRGRPPRAIPAKFIHLRVEADLHADFMGIVRRDQNETATNILTTFMAAEVKRRQREARQNASGRALQPASEAEGVGVDV